ncbi:hypothetical protein [Streptomyces sp. NPDC087212]|uniref:hypothetical protein n=1 Tax=Streptomyces sp. NPDC087212 TaxID=3365766 RepID=UPI0037F8B5A5
MTEHSPFDTNTTNVFLMYEVPPQVMYEDETDRETCVWCPTVGPLVDLGFGDFHACEPCRAARLTFLYTYILWASHTEDCTRPLCECDLGRCLAATHLQAALAMGRDVSCRRCCASHRPEAFRPVQWVSAMNYRTHLAYEHVGPCQPRRSI